MTDDKKSRIIINTIIMAIFAMMMACILEIISCGEINYNGVARIMSLMFFVSVINPFLEVCYIRINNKKEEGYILKNNFNKFGAVFCSMIFGYACTYLFNGSLLLVMQEDYVFNFMPRVLEILIIWALGALTLYKWRELKNMELKIPESNSSVTNENNNNYFKETVNNNVPLSRDRNIVDKIQCPKCNHQFDVNVTHIAVGQKFTFECPKCNLEMIKKRTEEVVETVLSNKAVSDSTKVSQDILLQQEQRDGNSKEVQERNFLESQVLELQQLQEKNNLKLVSQEQERKQLQQIHEQQIRELQQVQEKQLRELQQLQNQQARELQEIQN